MVAYKDRRSCTAQVVVWIFDFKGNAGGEEHDVFKSSGGCPLCHAAEPEETEEDGDEDAIAGAGYEGDVGDEEAGEEAGCVEAEREHVEDECDCKVTGCEDLEVVDKGGHIEDRGGGLLYVVRMLIETLSRRDEDVHRKQ